jgi:hypothetical protein
MELYNLVPVVEQERKDDMSAKRKSRSAVAVAKAAEVDEGKDSKRNYAGKETEYHDFIKKHHPGKFDDWTDWDRAKVFMHKMQEMNLWKEYVAYVNHHCKYRDAALSNKHVLSVNYQILNILKPYPELQHLIPFICRFGVPTNDEVPWLFVKSEDMKLMKLLVTKMSDSKLYKANSLGLLSGSSTQEPEEVTPAKRRKAQKDKTKETFTDTVADRPTVLLDDILNAIIFALKEVKHEAHDLVQVELWLMRCLEFGMTGIHRDV